MIATNRGFRAAVLLALFAGLSMGCSDGTGPSDPPVEPEFEYSIVIDTATAPVEANGLSNAVIGGSKLIVTTFVTRTPTEGSAVRGMSNVLNGEPAVGMPVHYEVSHGKMEANNAKTITDVTGEQGISEQPWILEDMDGEQKIVARVVEDGIVRVVDSIIIETERSTPPVVEEFIIEPGDLVETYVDGTGMTNFCLRGDCPNQPNAVVEVDTEEGIAITDLIRFKARYDDGRVVDTIPSTVADGIVIPDYSGVTFTFAVMGERVAKDSTATCGIYEGDRFVCDLPYVENPENPIQHLRAWYDVTIEIGSGANKATTTFSRLYIVRP